MEQSKSLNNLKNVLAELTFGRKITENQCVSCGKDVDPETEFRDALSAKEYNISHFCQDCQDDFFGE